MGENWKELYKSKLSSAEDAVKLVNSGDYVVFGGHNDQPKILGTALYARRHELENVTVNFQTPVGDPGWFRPGHKTFKPEIELYIGETARVSHDEKRCSYRPSLFSIQCTKTLLERQNEVRAIDVFMTVVSPPDSHGYCSFGAGLWNKKLYAEFAKKVIAEVDENQIKTYGDNFIHISQIDTFVEHTPKLIEYSDIPSIVANIESPELREKMTWALEVLDPPMRTTWKDFILDSQDVSSVEAVPAMLGVLEPSPTVKTICEYAATLIRDGDCLQFGAGTIADTMITSGVLDNKHDLGIHSETGLRGLSRLVDGGVITGKRKSLHQGKLTLSALICCSWEDYQYFNDNPILELYSAEYVVNVQTIAKNNNMVAMNNALGIDLTGQINIETVLGARMLNGTGGQPECHIGSVLSRGGRAVTLLHSTGLAGAVSRIVPQFDEGSVVSIPRYFADYVITEYGIARLMGKNVRERADELIGISHPDFRDDLRKEANRLFSP